MKAHQKVTSDPCPSCGIVLNCALGTNTDERPSAGDSTICGHCRALLIFDGDPLQLRRPTLDEETELLADPAVQRTIAVLAEFHRRSAGTPPEERGTTR